MAIAVVSAKCLACGALPHPGREQPARRRERMSYHGRYGALHWIRVVLWPLPILTMLRIFRATASRLQACGKAQA